MTLGIRLIVSLALAWSVTALGQEAPRLECDAGHPWRPPFGLERVGRPLTVVVEFPDGTRPEGELLLVCSRGGAEVERKSVPMPAKAPFRARVTLATSPDELRLVERKGESVVKEWTRQSVPRPGVEIEVIARPDKVVNPVDLGTIYVANGWLLLGPEQEGVLDVAILSRAQDIAGAHLSARFASNPAHESAATFDLIAGRRKDLRLELPDIAPGPQKDLLRVELRAGGKMEPYNKEIPVMRVSRPPRLPAFGATRLKLRYDAPISVRDPKTGAYSSINYEQGWEPRLDDVVVSLPNGARFVFWRGSSYIPFWAGAHNTGLCYEWAENISPPADAVDCVEPLMDKELRYGRVEIVESTASRVHVRWSYQSTDLHYKVWGDSAVEDYYFYPDGFGTRVLSLKADPAADYELSEFIILTPQGAYPFEVLPSDLIDVLFADGAKHTIRFPIDAAGEAAFRERRRLPALYRVRLNRHDVLAAVYFNPRDLALPRVLFGPFRDGGELVTPAYWGSHWPLARGNATGNAIDERIHSTPSHNSLMSWAGNKPDPLSDTTGQTLDALGRSRVMTVRRWAWLIGCSDSDDQRLRAWAQSYATPPSLRVSGAALELDSYAPERRALRLQVSDREVTIDVQPIHSVINPVFELRDAPNGALHVWLDDEPLAANRFAWDGRTLWIDATLVSRTRLRLLFQDEAKDNRTE